MFAGVGEPAFYSDFLYPGNGSDAQLRRTAPSTLLCLLSFLDVILPVAVMVISADYAAYQCRYLRCPAAISGWMILNEKALGLVFVHDYSECLWPKII
jgi:hypothetical protein